jgi:hypothetical protein
MEKGGSIVVRLVDRNDKIELSVDDQGKGIPGDLFPELGQRGRTFNKENGSGLGLYQARTNVEKWGGRLEIKSQVGLGTTVKLVLPKATPPKWFVPSIEVRENGTIVIVDDDASIHQIWGNRFTANLPQTGLPLVHLSTPEQLRKWKTESSERPALYLVDFEFLGKSENGLRLIESLGIEAQSILVTSRHEDPEVVGRCLVRNIRLIPKAMAGFVPLHFSHRSALGSDAHSLHGPQPTEGGTHAV